MSDRDFDTPRAGWLSVPADGPAAESLEVGDPDDCIPRRPLQTALTGSTCLGESVAWEAS